MLLKDHGNLFITSSGSLYLLNFKCCLLVSRKDRKVTKSQKIDHFFIS